jgi:hypothetical protein
MDSEDLFGDIDILEIVPLIALGVVQEARNATNTPIRSGSANLSGADYLRELLNCGNEKRIYGVLRMKKDTFIQLCSWFRKNSQLVDSRDISVEQQVAHKNF